jgi:hypothetical protein
MLKDNPFLKMHPPIYMGEPFRVHVTAPNPFWHESDQTKPKGEMSNLTAVIFRDFDNQYIVGAYMDDGLGIFGPCGRYNDIIVMWRVTELMPYCASINQHIYSHLLSAVVREKQSKERLNILLRALIPGDYESIYRSIMAKKIPQEIVQFVLDSQESLSAINPIVITEELRAGTIVWNEWDEAFTAAKVLRPDQADEIKKRRNDTVARYQKHIDNYVKFVKTDPRGLGISVMADQIVYLVERGIEKEYSATEVSALAAVVGLLTTVSDTVIMAPDHYTRDEAENEMRNTLILDAAAWLANQEKKWWKLRISNEDICIKVAKLEAIGVKYYLSGTEFE